MPSGKFITFEGIDGAGKSSHIDWFAQRLRERHRQVLVTREPGGPPLAEQIRTLLLKEPMTAQTETLLAFAARKEHLELIVLPALQRGTWVLCDRFTDSTYAYQGGGRGVGWDEIAWLEQWVQQGLQPDLTFWFDLEPEIAARRRAAVRSADRFEAEERAFFERVRAAYARRHQEAPTRIVPIDAGASVDFIRVKLEENLLKS